ncbi:hypothetical protein ACJRPK_12735 [Aquimarina sp. 2-A2]|uniref:hypothetical protein n=1 Tax=Aquimarina sp. 2-A2 TaxID=3382644 RepID=UPI00387EF77E
MSLNVIRFLFPLILFFQWLSIQAQVRPVESINYTWFDEMIGIENTNIFNGEVYQPEYYPLKGEHAYFKTDKFTKGFIEYDGQKYYNQNLKYDVYKDEILVKLERGYGEAIIKLVKNKVSKFELLGHSFKLYNVDNESKGISFVEILNTSERLTLVKKHSKTKVNKIKQRTLFESFKPNSNYFIIYKNKFFDFKKDRYLLRIFPQLKDEIQEILRDKSDFKSIDKDRYRLFLIEQIEKLELEDQKI